MLKISYETLISQLDEGKELDDYVYVIEHSIGMANYMKYHNPYNHILSFVNNYIIEMTISKKFSKHLHFYDEQEHLFFHEGKGNNKPDMYDNDGFTYEIKRNGSFIAGGVGAYELDEKQNYHNADYVIIYQLLDSSVVIVDRRTEKIVHKFKNVPLIHELYNYEN